MNLYHQWFTTGFLYYGMSTHDFKHLTYGQNLRLLTLWLPSWVRKCHKFDWSSQVDSRSLKSGSKVYSAARTLKLPELASRVWQRQISCCNTWTHQHSGTGTGVLTSKLWIRFQVSMYSSENKQGSKDPKVMCTSHLIRVGVRQAQLCYSASARPSGRQVLNC